MVGFYKEFQRNIDKRFKPLSDDPFGFLTFQAQISWGDKKSDGIERSRIFLRVKTRRSCASSPQYMQFSRIANLEFLLRCLWELPEEAPHCPSHTSMIAPANVRDHDQ
jgi:hypothetical protein